MASHSLILLRAPKPSRVEQFRASAREVMEEVLTFERTHAKAAWGATLVGVLLGLTWQALG